MKKLEKGKHFMEIPTIRHDKAVPPYIWQNFGSKVMGQNAGS